MGPFEFSGPRRPQPVPPTVPYVIMVWAQKWQNSVLLLAAVPLDKDETLLIDPGSHALRRGSEPQEQSVVRWANSLLSANPREIRH